MPLARSHCGARPGGMNAVLRLLLLHSLALPLHGLRPLALGARAPAAFAYSSRGISRSAGNKSSMQAPFTSTTLFSRGISRSSAENKSSMQAPFTSTTLFYQLDEGPIVTTLARKIVNENKHVIFRPAVPEATVGGIDASSRPLLQQTALVLLPGCFLNPNQYEAFALAIQEKSAHPIWVVVPKIIGDMANPLTAPRAIRESMDALRSVGYPSDEKVFLGGHSLGGIFLPDVMDRLEPKYRDRIAGNIFVASFVGRRRREEAKDAAGRTLPRLTVAGDLDGLIRSSRIAEDVERHVSKPIDAGRDPDEVRLNHSVVLVPGMNHFQIVDTTFVHFMERARDLPAEISREEATRSLASVVAEFMEVHEIEDNRDEDRKESLLKKIEETEDYLRPLSVAMKLEGNRHAATPCNLCEDEDASCDLDCNRGSRWVEKIQRHLTPSDVRVGGISDEFRRTWYINPFADPPFYHPKARSDGEFGVEMETFSEAVYEKPDFFFDGGFFSNTALELRSKLNSPQAIRDATGVSAPFEPGTNPCSEMNELAIRYALDHAPEVVKRRYLERGTKLRAGRDVRHNNGPSWIWSHLDFSKEGDCGDEDEPCRIVDAHAMNTRLDHPVPFAGGKLYCKLLSPARALEWMYVDSLRRKDF